MIEYIFDKVINPNDLQLAKDTYSVLCNTPEDAEDGEKILEKAITIIDECTDRSFEELKGKLSALYNEFDADQIKINDIINSFWKVAFEKADIVYVLASQFIESIYSQLLTDNSPLINNRKTSCELMLIGRICQVYREVFCLLENGFPDGAFARSRSLYELAVVFEFINISKECVAEAYLATSSDAKSRGNDYSWASSVFPEKKTISLSDLQRKCHLTEKDGWDSFIIKANKLLHSSAFGTVDRLGLEHDRSNNQVILLGPSADGLAEPAMNALLLFSRSVYIFSRSFTSGDNLIRVMLIKKLADMAIEEFKQLNSRIEE